MIEAVTEEILGGLYILIPEFGLKAPLPYVGRSEDVKKRLMQHIGPKIDSLKQVVATFGFKGSKNDFRILEQFFIEKLGGLDHLSNERFEVAEKPRSKNSKGLRKTLRKLDWCKR